MTDDEQEEEFGCLKLGHIEREGEGEGEGGTRKLSVQGTKVYRSKVESCYP